MREPLGTDPVAEAYRHWVDRGWSGAADGMALVTSLVRAQQIIMARIDAVLRPLDLSFARFELLTLLSFTRSGALPMAKASVRLQVHPTSVTNTVDRLEQAGLVARRAHPTDRRATLIEITAAGRDLADRAGRALNERVFGDLGIPAGDVSTLNGILARFRADAGDFAGDTPILPVKN
ncbi:MarR family transcriptional regulator [Citricoccus sp. SGAir0253]|uniref:MarR family winged helix-turn-helix transcriptional regulator n=1 Tax=Citricoccus sp. SGAir0253 TaxID=2567881 RepID=UPI0010CD4EE7|nr:MarR family transcriptional regulator [Citricoccus sp. SGAir0253]QCU78988.1 MarR family transcriptional regulator [Citricoccus sp. SGAir0253]